MEKEKKRTKEGLWSQYSTRGSWMKKLNKIEEKIELFYFIFV